jgi:hypothetical protein
MTISVLDLILFALVAMPLVLVATQFPRIKGKPRLYALAWALGAFVVDEFALLLVGSPYFYYHVLIQAVIVSVVSGILCVLGKNEQHRVRFVPSYALLALGLIAGSAYLYTHPDAMAAVVVLNVLLVLSVNGILLIRATEDRAIPYLSIMALWVIRHLALHEQWMMLNNVFSGAFFIALTGHLLYKARSLNQSLIDEREFQVEARNVVVNMLYDISSEKSISSVDYTLVRVLEAIIEAISVEGAAIYTVEDRADDGVRIRFSQSSGVFWTMQVHGEHGAGKTTFMASDLKRESYRVGEGLVGLVGKRMELIELDRGHDRATMRELGLNPHNVRNVLAMPLSLKGALLGVLVVQNRKNTASFSDEDTRLLEALTEQAAISINNARMYEELARTHRIRQEMNIAADIQKQLLPKEIPLAKNLRVHPFIRPAKEVGGDYYDFIASGQGHHGIVIGDVSGKGLPAGMIMIIARTTLQIVARGAMGTQDVLTRFSREMYPRMRRGQFMTLNFLLWDDEMRRLRYSAAGHEHILWYRRERRRSEIRRASCRERV